MCTGLNRSCDTNSHDRSCPDPMNQPASAFCVFVADMRQAETHRVCQPAQKQQACQCFQHQLRASIRQKSLTVPKPCLSHIILGELLIPEPPRQSWEVTRFKVFSITWTPKSVNMSNDVLVKCCFELAIREHSKQPMPL